MKVHCSADTNVGLRREINQDSYGICDQAQSEQKGHLMIVCDGMGGHAAGEVASRLGVEKILGYYYQSQDDDLVKTLEEAFLAANQVIYEQGEGTMGTTGVASLLLKNNLFIANVGDSRAYLIRHGDIKQISRDHSLVAEQVAAGIITAEQARHSNYRNMITRALGYRPEIHVDVFSMPVQVGDIVVLSSDGLHGLVDDDEIAQVATSLPLEQAVHRLIDMANDRGGVDNITVALALVEEVEPVADGSEEVKANDATRPLSFHLRQSATLQSQSPFATQKLLQSSSDELQAQPSHAQSNRQRFGLRVGVLGGAIAFFIMVGFVLVSFKYTMTGTSPTIVANTPMTQTNHVSSMMKSTPLSPVTNTLTMTKTKTLTTRTPEKSSTQQVPTPRVPTSIP